MPVPFGFSVGDLISGIELLIDASKSLRDTNGAQDDYRELGRELKHLRNGLECIEALSLGPTPPIQLSAAKAAVHDCLMCLDSFIQRNAKFSSLGSTPASHWTAVCLKKRWRMVQWALWKKADIAKFKSEVQQHAEAIQMLLATIQVNQLSAQGKMQTTIAQQSADHERLTKVVGKDIFDQGVEQQRLKRTLDDQHKLVSHIRTDVHSIIGRQRSLAQSMTVENRKTRDQILLQGKDSGRTMTQLQANVQHTDSQIVVLMELERSMAGGKTQYQRDLLHQLLQNATHSQTIVSNQDTLIQNQNEMLAELRDIATVARVSQAIPAQVLLSTPVVLLDARGRSAPFHLEFIDSSEAFIAVLKVRFKDVGLRKIENGQFALEDTTRKRSLRLSDAWSTTVRPGQHISMSMIFRLQESPNTTCPSCGHENEKSDETEVECANIACRLTYRRIVDISSSGNDQREEYREPSSQSPSSFCIPGSTSKRKRADSQENSVDDDIKQYTRVQILTQELFEQEDGDLPMQYRRLTTGSIASLYIANHSAMRSALDQTITSSYAHQTVFSPSPPEWPRGEATSNYWSFEDQRDFYNLALYYGIDWRAIAATMGTKTHIMVKNFYNRKIQEGDRGKQLEEEIARAEKLRAEGADMGPMPAPTPIRRRYISETRRRNVSAFPSSHAETSSTAAQKCPLSPAFDMPQLSNTPPLLSSVAKEPNFAQGVYEDQVQWNPTRIFEQWNNAFGSSSPTTRQQI